MDLNSLFPELLKGFTHFTVGNGVMIVAALVLIYLAVFKEIEPVLLLPIGFGCLLANIPLAGMTAVEGMTKVIYDAGIKTELFPLLIFIGVGAMIDFSPLLAQPRMVLLGAACSSPSYPPPIMRSGPAGRWWSPFTPWRTPCG